ncbi:YbaB/EbfC family nucleoid-associated protein [Mycoplasmatota bacterium]|nr:YbaB/EbfC family nucleoid-associated protein [Mycoplasmatota bacterium]
MNPAMLKKIQKLQKEMMETQKELENSVFTGTAGGVVTVNIKGTKELVGIKINPEAMEGPEDIEMLEDTIVAAVNNAMKSVDKETELKMGKYSNMLGGFGF